MKQVVSLSLDEALLARIDSDRGAVPRSAHVETLLCDHLGFDPKVIAAAAQETQDAAEEIREKLPPEAVSDHKVVGQTEDGRDLVQFEGPPPPVLMAEPAWRCKHRSCPKRSPKPTPCPVHLGSMVRVDREDLLIA